jgi:hypothetical protein
MSALQVAWRLCQPIRGGNGLELGSGNACLSCVVVDWRSRVSVNPRTCYPGTHHLYVFAQDRQRDHQRADLGGCPIVVAQHTAEAPPLLHRGVFQMTHRGKD